MNGLIPKEVTITGSFKGYGAYDGVSSGTELSVTFSIPDGMDEAALKEAMLRTKFTLDSLSLKMELAKGVVLPEVAQEIYTRMKAGLQHLIGEKGVNGVSG